MPRTNFLLLLLVAALAICCCRANVLRGRVLAFALKYVESSALEPIDSKTLVSGMLGGMLHSVGDIPYSAFIPPEAEGAYEEAIQGRNVGVGIWLLGLDSKELPLLWFVPMRGSPAEGALLRFGDRIAGVDGRGFAGMSIGQIVAKIAGADGSEVVLSVVDRRSLSEETALEKSEPARTAETAEVAVSDTEDTTEDTAENTTVNAAESTAEDTQAGAGDAAGDGADNTAGDSSDDGGLSALRARYGSLMRDVVVHRAMVQQDIVFGDRRDADGNWVYTLEEHPTIGYVKLDQFTDSTAPDLAAVLASVDGKIESLILDLRGNPGGFLPAAVTVANMFLNKGDLIVTTRERGGKIRDEFKAEGGQKYHWPMVVLLDGGSASASEIVSAALCDHQRATLIGHRSYGKGTVQQLLKLPRGMGMIRLTEASFWRPSGEPIHHRQGASPEEKWGVIPEIIVKAPTKGYLAAWLYRHLRSLEEYSADGSLLARLAETRLAENVEEQKVCCEIFESQVDEDAPMGTAPYFDPVMDAAIEHLEKLQSARNVPAPEL